MSALKDILKHVAPTLAAALGGPFAGVATKFILDKLGGGSAKIPEGSSIESYLRDLVDDADNLRKIKELDNQFKIEMEKMNIDVFRIEVEDRQSARDLAKTVYWPQVTITMVFLFAYFSVMITMFYVEASTEFAVGMYKDKDGNIVKQSSDLLDELKILLGVLTAGVPQILSFWFGGMFTSKEKMAQSQG